MSASIRSIPRRALITITAAFTFVLAASLVVGVTTLLANGEPHAARPASGRSQSTPPTSPAASTAGLIAVPPIVGEILLSEYADAVTQAHVVDYVHAVQMANVATYVDAVAAAEAETAREQAAAAARAAPRPQYSAPSTGGPTGACGGATNGADQFIHRESGGDPTILNGGSHASSPFNGSGLAFGCYQIMPGTWSGSCSDITTYDPASQAECASRLGLSAWNL